MRNAKPRFCNDSSVYADHFIRRAKISRIRAHNIRITFFSFSRDFTDRYRTLAVYRERVWRGYRTHVTPGRLEWFVVAISKLTSCYYSLSDRVHSNIFTVNICKIFTIHLYKMLLCYVCNSYLFHYSVSLRCFYVTYSAFIYFAIWSSCPRFFEKWFSKYIKLI